MTVDGGGDELLDHAASVDLGSLAQCHTLSSSVATSHTFWHSLEHNCFTAQAAPLQWDAVEEGLRAKVCAMIAG